MSAPAAAPGPGGTLVLRVLPTALTGGLSGVRRGRLLIERNLRVTLRAWYAVATGVLEPLFYLLSIGVGIGHLVGRLPGPHGTTIAYATYAAPALLASASMNGAVYEATMNVFFKLKFAKTYDAVLATPLGPVSVAAGEIGWAVLRASTYAVAFLAVMAALGDVASWWVLAALPAAVLLAAAFASFGMACTTFMRTWADFDLVQLAILPLFLFSTTFYPLGTYPRWLQLVVECTPLFHGITLTRSLALGAPSWALLGHAAYLAAMAALGATVAGRRIKRLLLS
ncbi:MAG TPA: ABC transporter permease [Acidimicrobiales bacterium]|nr:ABC transporter permease [Acidimicrobiales bacterium]